MVLGMDIVAWLRGKEFGDMWAIEEGLDILGFKWDPSLNSRGRVREDKAIRGGRLGMYKVKAVERQPIRYITSLSCCGALRY